MTYADKLAEFVKATGHKPGEVNGKRGQREIPGVRTAYIEGLSKKRHAGIHPGDGGEQNRPREGVRLEPAPSPVDARDPDASRTD